MCYIVSAKYWTTKKLHGLSAYHFNVTRSIDYTICGKYN